MSKFSFSTQNRASHAPDELVEVFSRARPARVVVVGDIILDRYVFGAANRVSPESPALTFEIERLEERLGGAGNVAANIVALGSKASLVGVVGSDSGAEIIGRLLKELKISARGLIVDKGRPTTTKSRYIATRQQLLRVDEERRDQLSAELESKLIASALDQIKTADGVLISDYGKGALSRAALKKIAAAARRAKIKIIVDPKGSDYSRYVGAWLITPNLKEASEASGIEIVDTRSARRAGKILSDQSEAENLLITLGPDGMALFSNFGAKMTRFESDAREVYDVTGAGDSVIATIGAFLFGGAELAPSVALANIAAGVEVGHLGARPVRRDELTARLDQEELASSEPKGKILTRSRAARFCAAAQRAGKKVVFTNGCFDLLHAGHLELLEWAKSRGDILIVGLNSDRSTRRLKGSFRPLTPQAERARLIGALAAVDLVTIFDEETPLKLIESIAPDVLVKGGDYLPEKIVGREFVENSGGYVAIAPLKEGFSTTALIDQIRASRGGAR